MSRKAFHIGIDLDIHAVSCPGVWLCPKGDAMLRISMLGASAHTKRVEPIFPLLFHESFHFRKTLTGVTSLAGLQDEMTRRTVLIQLVQWQVHGCRCVILASFRSSLSELLYPQPAGKRLLAGVDIDLLMDTTACFPGIIVPKIEVSTKVVIEEMVKYPNDNHDSHNITHKTLASKRPVNNKDNCGMKTKKSGRPRMRQKPVCHTRPNVRCYYCKQRVERARKVERKCDSEHPSCTDEDTLYIPYCNKCGDVVEENEVKQGKIILKGVQNTEKWESTCPCAEPQHPKAACNCNLCHKYNNVFKNSTCSSPVSKHHEWNVDHSSSPCNRDKLCSCLDTKLIETDRLRAGAVPRGDGQCGGHASVLSDEPDYLRDPVRKETLKDNEYRKMLQADLDNHYKKLYERVSRRSNRRES